MNLTFSQLCIRLDLECHIDGSSASILKVLPFSDSYEELDNSCVVLGTWNDYLRADIKRIPHFICSTPLSALSAKDTLLYAPEDKFSIVKFLSKFAPQGHSFACVKKEYPPEKLISLIEDEMKIAKDLTEDALRLYEALSASDGIQEIIDTAGELFNNPILVSNNSFLILGYTKNFSYPGEIWESIVANSCFPTNYLEAADHKFYEATYQQKEIVILRDPPEYGTIYVSKKLTVGAQDVGFVSVIQGDHVFQRYDFELFKVLRDVLNIAMSRNESLRKSHSSMYMYVLEELLSGRFTESTLSIRMAQAGFMPAKYLNVISVQFGKGRIYTPNYIQNRLETLIPCARGVVCEDNSVGMLVMRNKDEVAIFPNKKALISFLEECDLTLGISSTFSAQEISQTPRHYEQAQTAIHLGKTMKNQCRLCNYIDYMNYHILESLRDKESLSMFFHYKLREILGYDKEYGTAYAITLYYYIHFGYSALRAAQHLKVHRNTLDYRLNKLKELFGIALDDYDLLYLLHFSFFILKYENPNWVQNQLQAGMK